MTRKYPVLLLAAMCGWFIATSASPAATTDTTSTAASRLTANDADLIQLLTPDQLKQWNDAAKQIKDGDAKIEQGKALQTEQPNGGGLLGADPEADHAKGAALVNEGTKLRQMGLGTQAKLRTAARAQKNLNSNDVKLTATLNLTVPTAQWPEAVTAMSAQLFKTLNDKKYKHLYLAGVYAFDEPKYVANPELTAQVRKELAQLDKNGQMFDPKNDPDFKLAQEGGKLIINYAGRTSNQQSNAAAAIVGEVLYEAHKGYAAVSLRAVDLSNMRVVASQVMELSVEPHLGKMLGLAELKVPSKRIVPAAPDAKAAAADAPGPAVTLNLDESQSDFLGKARSANGSYGIAAGGKTDSLENRFAILMLKSYFLDKQKDVKISDVDFLTMALPAEKPADLAALPADLSGIFVTPNTANLADDITLDPLKARELSGGSNEITVGKIEIKRDLPKPELPSMADLRDGGYGSTK